MPAGPARQSGGLGVGRVGQGVDGAHHPVGRLVEVGGGAWPWPWSWPHRGPRGTVTRKRAWAPRENLGRRWGRVRVPASPSQTNTCVLARPRPGPAAPEGPAWPTSSSSAEPASTTSRTSRSTSPVTPSSSSPACPGRASRPWPSTPSSPRASGATSSRSRPTRASSWARWTSRTSTSSRASRPRSRSTRSPPRATRARRWARSPRSTTTCACSTRARVTRTAPSAGRPSSARRRSRSSTGCSTLEEGRRFQVLAPVIRGRKGEYVELFKQLQAQGFSRARVNGETHTLDDPPTLDKQKKHTIEVVVDRLAVKESAKRRLTDSVETALALACGPGAARLRRPRGRRPPARAALLGEDVVPQRAHARHRRARAALVLLQLPVRRLR